MAKLVLQNMTSGYLTQDIYNANNDAIEAAFENNLSRDGITPNEMGSSLDMNSFNINNVGNLNLQSLTINGVPYLPPGGVGVTTLAALTDVNDATPTVGNVLIANGVDWDSVPLPSVSSDIAVEQDGVSVNLNTTLLNFSGDVVTVTSPTPGEVDIVVQTPDPDIYGGVVGMVAMWPLNVLPNSDWLTCDGQSVTSVDYPDLFDAIGYAYGGSGINFNVPDLRGEFIRGWDDGAGVDPETGIRTDRGDGTIGDNVGTRQTQQVQSHTHTIAGGRVDGAGSRMDRATDNDGNFPAVNAAGGTETRPTNVNMQYMIRAYFSAGEGRNPNPIVQLTGGGRVVQTTNFPHRGELLTSGTLIPVDNTIPQVTEGDEIMTALFTPTNALNTIRVEVSAWLTTTANTDFISVALFESSIAATDSIATSAQFFNLSTEGAMQYFVHEFTAGTTNELDFRVRVGQNGVGSVGFNAQSAAGTQPRFLNTIPSQITITEYAVDSTSTAINAVAIEDAGTELSIQAARLNFGSGFQLTETAPDRFTIQAGPSGANSEYCPGYSFNFISTTQFSVLGLDVTKLFDVGRRIRFVDGASEYFGTITVSAFGTDTTLTMSMEGGDVLTNTITEFCLTSGAAGWSPIAGDPFGGDSINDISTGEISGVQHWVAVGDNGKIACSQDAGVTWVIRTSGTTEHLREISYDYTNEMFFIGGDAGVILYTSDGITYTLDTTSIPALVTGGANGNVVGSAYTGSGDAWSLMCLRATADYGDIYSTDQGATWNLGNTDSNLQALQHAISADATAPQPGESTIITHRTNNTSSRDKVAVSTSSWAAHDSVGTVPTCMGMWYDNTDSLSVRMYGTAFPALIGFFSWTGDDSTIGANNINDLAYSQVLQRVVAVGDLGALLTLEHVDRNTADSWSAQTNGLGTLANFTAVKRNDTDGMFIAVADNGQILRSSNGIS